MENHINPIALEVLMEQFTHENPMGDSRELSNYMYNKGFEDGADSMSKLF